MLTPQAKNIIIIGFYFVLLLCYILFECFLSFDKYFRRSFKISCCTIAKSMDLNNLKVFKNLSTPE
jgi:hypothetical protein